MSPNIAPRLVTSRMRKYRSKGAFQEKTTTVKTISGKMVYISKVAFHMGGAIEPDYIY